MAAEQRIRLSGVSWEAFEGLANRTRGGRLAYDRGELEIMSPSLRHEDFGGRLREFVTIACDLLATRFLSLGSTTWKASTLAKGIEADESFYLDPEKVAAAVALRGRGVADIMLYPPPDLVIEVDLRNPALERGAIYAAIGAIEIWRYDGESLTIERLNPDGTYDTLKWSGWFPASADEIERLIVDEEPVDDWERSRRIREWVRRELVPRAAGG